MASKVGKVIEFDGYTGEIVDKEKKYIFLDQDILDNVENNDIVVFQGEKVGDINRAFLVRKLTPKDKKVKSTKN